MNPAHPDLNVKRSALKVERSTETAAVDVANPWPGLTSFTEDTRGFFFGRGKETDELSRLVRRETLTVLFGQSGLGKSSLLQAGLFPILRESDHLPLYLRLDHNADGTLADQVKVALAAAFAAAKADAPAIGVTETLWEYFHRKDVDIWSAKNQLLTPVLAFDQFEEIFTLGRADEARRERSRAFLIELADLVENRAPAELKARFERGEAEPARYNFDKPSCRVILSLREDFLPDLEGLKQELPALIHNRLRLKRLNGAQALEAVTRPAPHLLAEGVGEKIVEFVSGARGGSAERLLEMEVEPALLSVICRELNERRRTLGQAQITPDLVSGNRREILNDFYERSVADLPEAMRIFVEDHLLTKSGFRDNLALETALEYRGVTRPLVDILVARRLLRVEERAGIQRVELTHDVLADVVRASRDSRQQRLAVADAGRRTRRMRYAIAGLVAAVIALSIGAVFGIRAQRRSAEQAGRADLLLGSRMLDDGKVADGLAYLVNAARRDPTNTVIAPRLLTELAARSFCLPIGLPISLPAPAVRAEFSADGNRIFVQSEDDILRVINAGDWKVEREYRFATKLVRGGWTLPTNNPAVVAVSFEDNSFVVCDVETARLISLPIRPPKGLERQRVIISPDGKWLACGDATRVCIWSSDTGELRATVAGNGEYQFSPDSRRLATGNRGNSIQNWSVPDGTPIGAPIPQGAYSVGWFYSPDGQRLFIRYSRSVQAYDIRTGEASGPFITFDTGSSFSWVGDLSITVLSPDGSRLVLSGQDRKALVLDVITGKHAVPALEHGGPIIEAKFSRDGKVLFTNCVDGLFRLWDLETGKLLAAPTFKQDRYAPAALSPDGKTVVAFSDTGPAHLLRLTHGPAEPLVFPRDATVAMVNLMRTTPTRLAWLSPTEFKPIDVASGRDVEGAYSFPGRIMGPAGSIRSLYGQTADAGDVLVVRTTPAGEPATWRAWTLGEREIEHDVGLVDVPRDVTYFRPSQTGFLAAANGTGPTQNTVGIWDLRSGRRASTLTTEKSIAADNITVISRDRKRAAFRTIDHVVHVADIAAAKELFELQLTGGRASIVSFRFTHDSAQLLTGDNWGGVQVWDAHTGRLVQTTQAHRALVQRFDFSTDGRYYASLSADGSVQIWDAKTHTTEGMQLLQPGASSRADFSSDNARIIMPSIGGTTRIWDVRSGQALTPLMDHHGETVGVVAYSPDGRFLQTYGTSGVAKRTIRIWSAPPDGHGARTPKWLLDLATICAGQRLTDEGKFTSAADKFDSIEDLRRELTALPASDQYAEWGRWFLSDSPTRSIAPGFTITPAEAKKLREDWEAAMAPATPRTGN